MIGTTELLIIVGVIVLLFGATAIPRLARSLGKARAEFEKGVREGQGAEEPETKGGAGKQAQTAAKTRKK